MHTGQNSIAPENSLPQLGQVRWGSAFMDLTVLPRRLKLCKEHGFARQPVAARLGTQALGFEPVAMPSSAEPCETRQPTLLACCGAASTVTSLGLSPDDLLLGCLTSPVTSVSPGGKESTFGQRSLSNMQIARLALFEVNEKRTAGKRACAIGAKRWPR